MVPSIPQRPQPRTDLRALVYCRVSTSKQKEQGVSLEAQAADLRDAAVKHGVQVVEVFSDAISGKRTGLAERPSGAALLRALGVDPSADEAEMRRQLRRGQKRGAPNAVMFSKVDRFGRDSADTKRMATLLLDAGIQVYCVQASGWLDPLNSSQWLVFGMLSEVAEFEAKVIAERTSAALAHKKQKGQRVGRIPYGFKLAKDGTHLEPCPAEEKVLRRILKAQKVNTKAKERLAELAGMIAAAVVERSAASPDKRKQLARGLRKLRAEYAAAMQMKKSSSPLGVARILTEEGVLARDGGAWDPSSIFWIWRTRY